MLPTTRTVDPMHVVYWTWYQCSGRRRKKTDSTRTDTNTPSQCHSICGERCRTMYSAHTLLYFTILHHTLPYSTILYHTLPYSTILYHTLPYSTILYHTPPYSTIRIKLKFLVSLSSPLFISLHSSTNHESNFSTFHTNIINKTGAKGGQKPGCAITISLRTVHGNLTQLKRDYPAIFIQSVEVVHKLGFPDIIVPGE